MELFIKFDTVKSDWSIVYIEGLQVIMSKKILCGIPSVFSLFAIDSTSLWVSSPEMVINWSKGTVHFADTNNWSKISRDTNKDKALQGPEFQCLLKVKEDVS